MAEIKEHILSTASRLFSSYGIRSITMDDIAKEISISKKTIYQHFKDKDEIVGLCTKQSLENEQARLQNISQQAETAIDELLLLTEFLRNYVRRLNPSALYDIKKYYYDAWKLYIDFKENIFTTSIKNNLIRGIDEGYYRENINPEVLAILNVEQFQITVDEAIYPQSKFSLQEIQSQTFELFIQGILTQEGKEFYIKKCLEKNEVQ